MPPPRKRYRQHQSVIKPRIDFTKHLFSDELVLGIFTHLTASDLIECGKVNRAWYRLAHDAELWRPLFEERFDKPLTKFKSKWHPVTDDQSLYANWKDRYRLHQNWLTGFCMSYSLKMYALASTSTPCCDNMRLQPRIQYSRGVLCVLNDSTHQVEVWHIGRIHSTHLCSITDDQSRITAIKLVTTSKNAKSSQYNIAIGHDDGGFSLWTFSIASSSTMAVKAPDLKRLCYYQGFDHNDAVVVIDLCSPVVILCTASMKLTAFDTNIRSSSSSSSSASSLLATPRIIFTLHSQVPWQPVLLDLAPHSVPSQWRAVLCYGIESSLGAQEMIFTMNGLISSRHSSVLCHDLPLFPPAADTTALRVNTTSVTYSQPFLMTAHTNNTIRQYRITSTPQSFRLEFLKTIFGHTSQVTSLAVNSEQGRLISGSRAGLKIWDLLSLDQYKKRANDYVVTLQPEDVTTKNCIPVNDIKWIQMDDRKIVAVLENSKNYHHWLKVWSFDP